MRWLMILTVLTGMARAEGEKPGEFDYYVMALSWSPNWCAIEGDARGSDQCDARHDHGWILHGLWPQYEQGWPSYCRTSARDPSRSHTRAMEDIMGTAGLAWHQWKKHGRCSGLSAETYFEASRSAYEDIQRPEVFRKLKEPVSISAGVIEEAFLVANPELSAEMITITCKEGYVQEARLCLTKELEPRSCGADLRRDCTSSVQFDPVR